MKQKITAGAVDSILKVIKQISDSFFKLLDKLMDYGVEITKEEELKDGSVKLWCQYDGKQFGMILTPILDENGEKTEYVNITIHYQNRDIKIDHVKESDAEQRAMQELQKQFGSNFGKQSDASASKKLQVTLQKITSATETEIRLTAIKANYDIKAANAALDMVLDDADFFDAIPEEPTSFEILERDEDMDIRSIPEVDLSGIYTDLAQAAIQAWCTFSDLTWNCVEPIPPEIFDIRCCLMDCVDYFAELGGYPISVKPYDHYEYDPSEVSLDDAVQDLEYFQLLLRTYQIDFPMEIQEEIADILEELNVLKGFLPFASEPEEQDVF